MKSDAQYKLMEFSRHVWVYALLLGGAIVFSWPFLWMATTSVKVDREMFGEKIHLWPQRPIPQLKSPYIDERFFNDVTGKRMDEILPALEQQLGSKPVARGVYRKLLLTVPDAEWDKPVAEIVKHVDAAMVNDVLGQIRRHLSLGQLRARSYDLQEDQLVAPDKVATTWQVTGNAQLVPANEGRDVFGDLHYDFSAGDTVELSQTFTTSFPLTRTDPEHPTNGLYRLQLYLRNDDSWHDGTVYVEKLGKKFKAERPYSMQDYNWGIGTWQELGPDDKSNKIRTWISLREIGPSNVTGPNQLKVTFELKRNTALGAWWAKARHNYRFALDNMPFWRYVATSIFLVILNLVGTLLSCSLVAYSFARLQWPGRNFCFALMLATMMVPGQVTMIPGFLIMKSLGWYNTLYPLWVGSFFASAFNVFLLRQFLKGIPRDLEDAAKIDGCGFWRIYWHIMLPLIKPTLAAIAIFTFMGAWNDFMGPLIYLSDQRLYPLSFGLYALNVSSGGMGSMMAGSLLMTTPVIVIFFFAQKYFIQGVTLTGMKG